MSDSLDGLVDLLEHDDQAGLALLADEIESRFAGGGWNVWPDGSGDIAGSFIPNEAIPMPDASDLEDDFPGASPERIEELTAGSAPTAPELKRWQDEWISLELDRGQEFAWAVYRYVDSRGRDYYIAGLIIGDEGGLTYHLLRRHVVGVFLDQLSAVRALAARGIVGDASGWGPEVAAAAARS
jgi:hypothetical protein